MRDPFTSNKRKRRWPRLLEIDSVIDSALFRAGSRVSAAYDAFSSSMLRFRVAGWRRWAAEVFSEGATLSVGALLVVLAFARPAFEAVKSQDWRTNAELSVTFLDRTGREIGKRGIRHSDAVPLEEMPEHLIKATLSTEDRRFYQHFGIDVPGTLRALLTNVRASTVVQGGSSLSQQLAKNLFLSNERTLERKIKEAFLALWLEANFTKDEILKLYLDRAYMGGGAFGVEAAAQFYFGKSVRDITLAEAAMMAGLFKAPTRYAPHVNLPAARARANEVLGNLVQSGLMTEGQVAPARRHPAKAIPQSADDAPNYFLDWAFDEVKRLRRSSETVLIVKTTFDAGLQRQSEVSVESALRQFGEQYDATQAAMVITDPDGAVRAMVGGRDYGASQFNRATNALRQPGSSFKPYVYVAALENGYKETSVVVDAPISIGNWSPQNYARSYSGPVTLTIALARSINTIPVRLAQAIGRDKIVEVAHRMGVRSDLPVTRALPLGVAEVTVLEHTAAYGAFANGGKRSTPYAVLEIRDSQNIPLYRRDRDEAPPEQIIAPEVVHGMNVMLHAVTENGTGQRARIAGLRTAGKTGTSQGYRDAWFIGFTGNYVAGVWFGNDDFRPMKRMTGGSIPAQTWQRVMAYAHQGIEPRSLPGLPPAEPGPAVAMNASPATDGEPIPPRPLLLSQQTLEVLDRIESRFRSGRRMVSEVGEDHLQTSANEARAGADLVARTVR